ncbi:MAG: DUF4446 family protein [Oscillospiraceae bacterium]|nr:DUF4446 family protein [Oscillospiraceae bacterium]
MVLDNTTLLFIAMAVIIILVIICFILNMINTSKINTLLDYSEDGDIITALQDYYDKVDDLSKTISNSTDTVLLSRLSECENKSSISIKNIGIVNFDAFDDVKGNLSFALAMLNDNNDGIILTSLFGHNSCNTYVREIRNGEASIKLLNEEKEALSKAKN